MTHSKVERSPIDSIPLKRGHLSPEESLSQYHARTDSYRTDNRISVRDGADLADFRDQREGKITQF